MDDDLLRMVRILKKILPKLQKNPKMMRGCDISEKEIEEFEKNKFSLNVLQHMAGDGFFTTYNEELRIKKDEAIEIEKFLFKSAVYFLDELKEELPELKK